MSDDDANRHLGECAPSDRIAITFAEMSAKEMREFTSLLKQVTLDHLPPDDE